MAKHKLLRPEYSSKIIAVIFISISVYLFLFTDHINPALASAFIGILTLLIVNFPTVEEDVSIASLKSGVLSYHEILDDLEVASMGIHIPPKGDLTGSRAYIPASESIEVPEISDEMTIVSLGRGKIGIAVTPPGYPLLEEAKERIGYDLEDKGLESGRECMGHLSEGMGLARSFSFRREDGNVKLRITHGRYQDYCASLREVSTNICTRTGCPICSAFLTGASESLSSRLKVVDFEVEGRHIKFDLEVI